MSIVFGLTAVNTVLGILRLELLLQAFTLRVSLSQLLVLMLISSLVGNLPVPIPGAGTWATAKALKSLGIAGPGAGGYILVLRVISAIETPILALTVLVWWSLGRGRAPVSVKELRALRAILPSAAPAQRSRSGRAARTAPSEPH